MNKTEHDLSRFYEELKALKAPVEVVGLRGASKAYVLSKAGRLIGRPLVIVAPTETEADALRRELEVFGANPVLDYPAWDTLPFDHASPGPDRTARRVRAYLDCEQLAAGAVIVTSARAIAQRIPPVSVLASQTATLRPGEELDREGLLSTLASSGYRRTSLAEAAGEYSIRGGIFDVYSPGGGPPIRIELEGETIESLRRYDPMTQRSLDPIDRARILPARELLLNAETNARAEERILRAAERHETDIAASAPMLEKIRSGIAFPGIEHLLPFFVERLEAPLERLSRHGVVTLIDPARIEKALDDFESTLFARVTELSKAGRIFPKPLLHYVEAQNTKEALGATALLRIEALDIAPAQPTTTAARYRFETESHRELRRAIAAHTGEENRLRPLADRIAEWQEAGVRTLVFASTAAAAERLRRILESYGLEARIDEGTHETPAKPRAEGVVVRIGDLPEGFYFPQERLAIVSEEEIFGPRIRRRGAPAATAGPLIDSIRDIHPNDYLVHVDHGIGIFRGLTKLKLDGFENDFLLIEYAGGDRLYLPANRMNLVHRYVGPDEASPKVDRLGGASWKRAKKKAAEAIREVAEGLVKIYAARKVLRGHAFSGRDRYFTEFEADFPYEETPDQIRAVEEVLADMEAETPMDRLICGDVGFGKTEVAIRAAFRAIMDGKQAAVLVPTTILAEQHHQTMSRRFEGYPVSVESLSRFKTRAEQRALLERLHEGKTDIVIGTHRLLQEDVLFRNLGLLVIDEEQRFGVKHKEKLRDYRKMVDVLTLTATPIPRTLHMALVGIRDLSLIHTPPEDRHAIRTRIMEFSDETIREAILREMERGGQVFFVHNRVRTIGAIENALGRIVPEARTAVAHGQMEERRLARVMEDFIARRVDVLLCTSIIESGLDIPSANTIIIDRPDRFGLADLYQLRGRVGRSAERAFAYLLIPERSQLAGDARERLAALEELTELGSGFRLATHDLEIRGAGSILGAQQSGHIAAIGYELYTEMMERCVRELKGEEVRAEAEPEINLKVPGRIPDDYVPDTGERLVLYRRLAGARSEEDLADLARETEDRYGPLPEPVELLIEVIRVKILMKNLAARSIERRRGEIVVHFTEEGTVDPNRVLDLVEKSGGSIRVSPDSSLTLRIGPEEARGTLEASRKLLQSLS